MSLYQQSAVQMSHMLRSLDGCLDKAIAYAESKEFPADNFAGLRLAPDMHPLTFQVQSACDSAKGTSARLAGIEPPKHEDNETTMAELKARIAKTLAFLSTLEAKQFEGAAEREIRLSFLPGKGLKGVNYLREMALPNFYFHVTTAYALLRSHGVNVGKRDFITYMTMHDLAG